MVYKDADGTFAVTARNNYRPLLLALKVALERLGEYDSECPVCGGSGIQSCSKAACGCNDFSTIEEIEALLLAQQGDK